MSSERQIQKIRRFRTKDYINALPDEMLVLIFDGLDVASMKQAAAVCRRWNSIIFFSSYISRFTFHIDPPELRTAKNRDGKRPPVRELIKVMTKSKRRYQNLVWCVKNWNKREFESVWKVIHQKVPSDLHSLTICGEKASYLFLSIVEAIPSMSQLRSLSLIDSSCNAKRAPIVLDNIPTLCNDSVTHLKIISAFQFRLNMPQLRSLECQLYVLKKPETPRLMLVPSNLQFVTFVFEIYGRTLRIPIDFRSDAVQPKI